MAKKINLGKVGITTAGAYDSSKAYEKLSCVLHNGISWVSTKDVPVGYAPAEGSTYWQKMSERGEQGPQGERGPQGNSAFDGNGVEIVNNLTQGGESAVLSAEQGKVLKGELTELSVEASIFSVLSGYESKDSKFIAFFKSMQISVPSGQKVQFRVSEVYRNYGGDGKYKVSFIEIVSGRFYQLTNNSPVTDLVLNADNGVALKFVVDWSAMPDGYADGYYSNDIGIISPKCYFPYLDSEQTLAFISQSQSNFEAIVDEYEQQTQGAIDSLSQVISSNKTDADNKFSSVNSKIETEKARLDDALVEIANLANNNENAATDADVAALDSKFTNRLDSVESSLEESNSQLQSIAEDTREATSDIASIKSKIGNINYDDLSESARQMIESKGGGSITNFPDEEDLSVEGNRLKFADRLGTDGMAYVILRKSASVKSQINGKNNTIFVVRYDFDLSAEVVSLGANCCVLFEGGSFSNGTIVGNNTLIKALGQTIFTNVTLSGSFANEWKVEWFGASRQRNNNDIYINYAISSLNAIEGGSTLLLSDGYIISDTIYLMPKVSVKGISRQNFYDLGVPTSEIKKASLIAQFASPNKWIVDVKTTEGKTWEYNDFLLLSDTWSGTRFSGVVYSDFDIIVAPNSNAVYGAIRLRSVYNSAISNIAIYGTFYGMHCTYSWNNTFDNLFIRTYYNAIYLGTDFTVNAASNIYMLKIDGGENLFQPTFVKDNSLPPYVNVDSPAIIMEGNNHDKSQATFIGAIFQDYSALIVGSRYAAYLPYPYLENGNLFDTLIWNADGKAEICGFMGSFYNCKVSSYEFGTQSGQIIAEGIPLSRCWNNYEEGIWQANKSYYIKGANFANDIAYNDTIKVVDGKVVGYEKTPTKVLEYTPREYWVDDANENLKTPIIYNVGMGIANIHGGGASVTFNDVLSREDLPKEFVVRPKFYNKWDSDHVVEDRIMRILPHGYSNYAKSIRLNVPLKFRNAQLHFDGGSTWAVLTSNTDAAFVVEGNFTLWQNNGYSELGSTPMFRLTGEKQINIVVYNAPSPIFYASLDKILVNKDYPYPYVITLYNSDNTERKEYKNKPTLGIPVGYIVGHEMWNGVKWVDLQNL